MSTPFTFGIEIELAVALLVEGQDNPDPSETRTQTDNPNDLSKSIRNGKFQAPTAVIYYRPRVQLKFIRVMEEAGFQVNPFDTSRQETTKWTVVGDISIHHPPQSPIPGESVETDEYSWIGVEIKSPALLMTQDSLDEVQKLCLLLPTHFKLITNSTCGLHVHVGHGQKGFTTSNVTRIIAFLYAFEPQLDTLHPLHRYNNAYAKSMRDRCNFVRQFQEQFSEEPTTLAVITKILSLHKGKSPRHFRRALTRLVQIDGNGKNGAYNFNGVSDNPDRVPEDRPTIEFRQHEGTLDGVRIAAWIRALTGLLDFVESEDYDSLVDLLTTVSLAEKWTKRGDGKDTEREAEMGPALADGPFTIIELFQHCGMDHAATYYGDKVYKHNIPPRRVFNDQNTGPYKWTCTSGFNRLSGEEKESYRNRRRHFYKLQVVKSAAKLAGDEWSFDEDDKDRWPEHQRKVDWDSGSGSGSGSGSSTTDD
ncbi:hypothetical protein MBM_05123 [Drepanopeziza brunnea f. sp. 'multigermtubi' MB_m1]|uniref:Amidoligase enzyme n=1 Tax=Marssonina brunnea f. sp. multigermtubi (strain MB_m1) TaxID=1072389 RepID=K1XVG5_MARBU|nr:uncharacterized protein MBM_05123 [Drepanopeziza brunnea f. sp. 'multigermtubi' MB_m1]EKD16654.1 hypothetical protein MBM_05123 [Drepanopeziza brunnea f. sp. 'multigermtubi' MB_m1]